MSFTKKLLIGSAIATGIGIVGIFAFRAYTKAKLAAQEISQAG